MFELDPGDIVEILLVVLPILAGTEIFKRMTSTRNAKRRDAAATQGVFLDNEGKQIGNATQLWQLYRQALEQVKALSTDLEAARDEVASLQKDLKSARIEIAELKALLHDHDRKVRST